MAERIRLTITVTPQVHDTFQQMAEISGRSLGRCMGDWLEDTAEGAQLTVHQMQELRLAPARAQAAFLHEAASHKSFMSMVHDQEELLSRAPRSGAPTAAPPLRAPSSNTGLKSPPPRKRQGAKS